MTDKPDIHDKLEVVSSTTRKAINAGFGCGLSLVIFILWAIGIAVIEGYFHSYLRMDDSIIQEASLISFIYTILFCLLAWFLIDRRKMFEEVGLRITKWSATDWIYGLLFGGFGVGVVILVISIFGDILIDSERFHHAIPQTVGPWSWQAAALLFIFSAGQEEIFLRGLMYPLMRRYLGIVWAIIISSLIFSLMHFMNPGISDLAKIDLFMAGVLLALLREYTGNLWLTWGVHFGWNFALVATGLIVSGITVDLEPQTFFIWPGGEDTLTGGAFGPEGGWAGITANLVMIIIVIALIIVKKNKLKAQSQIQTAGAPALL
ncbi:CPBP family intramembrane metalloprotease [bacterium]|nr:CPBP family intramembrane metalloprotease [bacterium]